MTRRTAEIDDSSIDPSAIEPVTTNALETKIIANLLEQGFCDSIAINRAAGMAADGEFSLPQALVQLGLVAERVLAKAFGTVLSLQVAGLERYPNAAILPNLLHARFLRSARAIPVAIESHKLVFGRRQPAR